MLVSKTKFSQKAGMAKPSYVKISFSNQSVSGNFEMIQTLLERLEMDNLNKYPKILRKYYQMLIKLS